MRKLSKEKAFGLAQQAALRHGGTFIEGQDWKGTRYRYFWNCALHGAFSTNFSHVVYSNNWCRKCQGLNSHKKHEVKRKELIGRKFGMRTILSFKLSGTGHNTETYFECKCHCGEINWVHAGNLRKNKSCLKCGLERTAEACRLTEDEVKVQLTNMGLTVGPRFKYNGGHLPLEDLFFKGRRVKKQFFSLQSAFKKTGLPVGFTQGSVQDSWLGFVCSLASNTFQAYAYPDSFGVLELDGYDLAINKAYEFNGSYYHKNRKSDDKKKQLCIDNGIELKVFEEKEHPKSRIDQAKLVLDFMYPYQVNSILDKLKEPGIDLIYQNWCDSQGLFDRKKAFQNLVKKDLTEKGPPIYGTPEMRRLMRVVSPKAKYYSQEIRDFAIKIGFIPNGPQKRLNHSRAMGIRPFKDQFGNTYQTTVDAGKAIGVSSTMVSRVLKGQCKATRGFILSFV